MPSKAKVMWILALVALFAGGSMAYLFRKQNFDNGFIEYCRYRWGSPHKLAFDTNKDGRIDAVVIINAPFGKYGKGEIEYLEYWEDVDFDGHYENHVILTDGVISRVEVDRNDDGEYEEILTGDDARNFYEVKQPQSFM